MLKIDTLRAAVTAAVPELASKPARLKMWVDRGAAQCRQTKALAFAYSFRLNMLVEELATDISVLSLAIFIWLRTNQPELLKPNADGFIFDVDVLDNNTADVLIQLALTQNVTVSQGDDGKYTLEYLPEPEPMFEDDLGLGGTDPIPLLGRITLSDGAIIETDGSGG